MREGCWHGCLGQLIRWRPASAEGPARPLVHAARATLSSRRMACRCRTTKPCANIAVPLAGASGEHFSARPPLPAGRLLPGRGRLGRLALLRSRPRKRETDMRANFTKFNFHVLGPEHRAPHCLKPQPCPNTSAYHSRSLFSSHVPSHRPRFLPPEQSRHTVTRFSFPTATTALCQDEGFCPERGHSGRRRQRLDVPRLRARQLLQGVDRLSLLRRGRLVVPGLPGWQELLDPAR